MDMEYAMLWWMLIYLACQYSFLVNITAQDKVWTEMNQNQQTYKEKTGSSNKALLEYFCLRIFLASFLAQSLKASVHISLGLVVCYIKPGWGLFVYSKVLWLFVYSKSPLRLGDKSSYEPARLWFFRSVCLYAAMSDSCLNAVRPCSCLSVADLLFVWLMNHHLSQRGSDFSEACSSVAHNSFHVLPVKLR